MSRQLLPADGDSTAVAPGAPARTRRRPARLWLTPAVVLVAFAVTYWVASRGRLQAVERAFINPGQLLRFTWEHLQISLTSTLLVLVTAIPLGVALSRRAARSVLPLAGIAANIGQAATAFGVMVLLRVGVQTSANVAAVLGMGIYCFLPVFRGTLIGVQQVDRDVIKAAFGTGMSRWQVLWQVELPLSVPILLAGVRTALVLNVATTTVAALVGAGGLGLLIIRGFTVGRDSLVVLGAVGTAGVAILADWAGALAERVLRPKGLRSSHDHNTKGNQR